MSANLEKIADDLSALTVIEAAELSKLLEEKWGVSAAAPVAAAAAAPAVAAARVAVKFAKANAKLEILGGVLFKDLLDAAAVKFLAELPSLDELRASIIAMVNTPATRIAQVLQAPGSQVARVLNAYSIRDEAA